MKPFASAWSLLRARPSLLLAWLAVLVLPPMLGLLPLDLSLAPILDPHPVAASLLRVPADDGLWMELMRMAPGIPGAALGGLAVALLLAVPALWLLAGHVAAAAIQSYAPARLVAGRALGVALVALPLRALPIVAALGVSLPAFEAQTVPAAMPYVVGALALYLVGSAAIGALVDLARGAALADVERGLFGTLGAGFGAARRRPALFFALVALDLALLAIALGALTLSRPLGVLRGVPLLLSMLTLIARAAGGIVGVAAAATTGASPRAPGQAQ
jgi:hypothetical protein